MSITTHFTDKILDHFLRGDVFLSLHAGEPGDKGANELAGRGYIRARIGDLFGHSSGGVKVSSQPIEFRELPGASVTHVALWDAASGGTILWIEPITPRKLYPGDSLKFEPGKLGFAFN